MTLESVCNIAVVVIFGVWIFIDIRKKKADRAKAAEKPAVETTTPDIQKLSCMTMHFLEPIAVNHLVLNDAPHTAIAFRCRICTNMSWCSTVGTFTLEQLNTPSQAEMDRIAKRTVESQ